MHTTYKKHIFKLSSIYIYRQIWKGNINQWLFRMHYREGEIMIYSMTMTIISDVFTVYLLGTFI